MIPAIPAKLVVAGVGLLTASAVAFAAGWKVESWRCEAGQKAAVEDALAERIKHEESALARSDELEDKLAALAKANRALTRKVSNETRNPDYRCPVPANGVSLLEVARAGHPETPGEPDR